MFVFYHKQFVKIMKNGVLFQYFEWNLPNDGQLWRQLKEDARHLADIGISAVWIPPAYKADEQQDEGYATYDLYDFGEFDQKGTVRTKYGTRTELEEAIKALHDNDVQVILDAVLNHKAGGDHAEKFQAVEVNPDDRNEETGEPHEIESYTGYDFPGRGDRHSPFKWHWYHFSGVGSDSSTGTDGIFRIIGEGKGWSQGVDKENGNYDYLLANDIDVDNPEVADELKRWGRWVVKEFGFDGFRMDAVKHIDHNFIRDFLTEVRKDNGDDFYVVSEYWSDDLETMADFLAATDNSTDLFDVPLHFNFFKASEEGAEYDLSRLLDGTLVQQDSRLAVTFVDNHDSQEGSSLQSAVQDWFKPLAYALILLMREGYPVIFYGDYYSISHDCCEKEKSDKETETVDGKVRAGSFHRRIIDMLLDARKRYAYGDQTLLFDHPSTVGLIRHGEDGHPGSGLVLLISNDQDGDKTVDLGNGHAGERWHEITGSIQEEVVVDEDGKAVFTVRGRNLAVWVKAER